MEEDIFYGLDLAGSVTTSSHTSIRISAVATDSDNPLFTSNHSSSPVRNPAPTHCYSATALCALWTPEFQQEVADTRQLQQNQYQFSTMSRSFSDPSKPPRSSLASGFSQSGSTRHSRSTVKHLTCFWWKSKGECRFSDDDCLYAHYDTGHYTEPPRQIIPGEPALAGRKLDRAMRNLVLVSRSSASLHAANEDRNRSRPNTPAHDTNSSPQSSSQVQQLQGDVARLTSDNHFLRNLVDQNVKEKATLISHIEELQSENKAMRTEAEGLRTAQEQLLVARGGLQNRIQELEAQAGGTRGFDPPYRVVGSYGRLRMDSETRFLGGLLDE